MRSRSDGSSFALPEDRADLPAAAGAIFGSNLGRACRYADLLSDEGVRWGLLGPREAPRVWPRHILNSAALAQWVPAGATVADIGSGAGLPGIPLLLARPALRMTLVEPLQRRVRFLELAREELELDVEICRARAETLPPRRFTVLTARALAPLPRLIEMCQPLLDQDGVLLALKGASASQELAEAGQMLAAHGLAGTVLDTAVESEPVHVVKLHRRRSATR